MLAYPLPEAEALLGSRLQAAQSTAAGCEDDIDFLREQITVGLFLSACVCCCLSEADERSQTIEVATARVYNWDIAERRKEKGDEKT